MKGFLISLSIVVAAVVAMVVFKRDPQTAAGGGIDSSASAPIEEAASAVPVVKRNPVYQIISTDTNEFKNAVYLEILIQDKITMEDMIAIAHNERRTYGGDTRLHAGFRYKSMNNPYYGTASYLVDCSDCQQRDEDGELISAILQYKESTEPETTHKLPKGISEDAVIARFYDHGWERNALIAYTNKSKTKASYYWLYKDEDPAEEKLRPLGNGVFQVIETAAKYRLSTDKVEYIQTNGTISYTYERMK
jgi:hypothetical protein